MTGPDDFVSEQRTPRYGGFSEADLVEQPAIELFAELGWTAGNLFGEFRGGASAEGRSSKRDAILPNRLRLALERLNPGIPQEALDDAFSILTRERGAIDPIRANAEVHDLLRKGVPVDVRDADRTRKTEFVRVVDWESAERNESFLASQVWFAGELYTKRADLVGFVNGLPLLFVELKASHKAMADAYNDNLSDYRATIPHVFTPNAFVILSNGLEAVLGAPYAPFEFFNEWKRRKTRTASSRNLRRPISFWASTAPSRRSRRSMRTGGGSAFSGTRRAQGRVCRCCSSLARLCARSRATGRSSSSPTERNSTIRSPEPSPPAAS